MSDDSGDGEAFRWLLESLDPGDSGLFVFRCSGALRTHVSDVIRAGWPRAAESPRRRPLNL